MEKRLVEAMSALEEVTKRIDASENQRLAEALSELEEVVRRVDASEDQTNPVDCK